MAAPYSNSVAQKAIALIEHEPMVLELDKDPFIQPDRLSVVQKKDELYLPSIVWKVAIFLKKSWWL